MPVQYTTILDEHKAVREKAGLFDASHMGEFHVSGPEAPLFLDRLLVNRISSAPTGKAVYSPMCATNGGVIDDLIVYRTGEEDFLVCVNAGNTVKDFDWFQSQAKRWSLDLTVENHSDQYALLALQGPQALAVMQAIGIEGIEDLKAFRHRLVPFCGGEARVARTGYTGEAGFEMYMNPAIAEKLARELVGKGEPLGLRLCGLGARDSLRLEAGLPLYGHELSDTITPLEAGLGWTIKWDKEDFIGKYALMEQRDRGIPRTVVHFHLEGRRIAREGTAVLDENDNRVGEVLSGTLSPMTGGPIGSALVKTEFKDHPLTVDLRGHRMPLNVAQPPLYKKSG